MILESIKYLRPAVCSASLEENSHLYTNVLSFWEQMVESNKKTEKLEAGVEHSTQQREAMPCGEQVSLCS